MQIIDPHLHLFNLAQGNYGWLKPSNPPHWPDKHQIHQNFGEADLRLSDGLSLAGYVHIEAGYDNQASWREVDWVTEQANLPLRAVAHLDLTLESEPFLIGLDELRQRSCVVGVRHILDDQVSALINHPNFAVNLQHLAQSALHFELQFDSQKASDSALIFSLLNEYPALKFILNHAGFCGLENNEQSFKGLEQLANAANLSIKSSGFDMADRAFSVQAAANITARLCQLFGQERVMLASNFPLVRLSMSYADYWSQMIEALQREALPVQRLVFENAKQIYGFNALLNDHMR